MYDHITSDCTAAVGESRNHNNSGGVGRYTNSYPCHGTIAQPFTSFSTHVSASHLLPFDLTHMPPTLRPSLAWRRILTSPPSFVANAPFSVPWSTPVHLLVCRTAQTIWGGCFRRPSTEQKLGNTVASGAQLREKVLFLSSASATARIGPVSFSHVGWVGHGSEQRGAATQRCSARAQRCAMRGFCREKKRRKNHPKQK